MEWNKPILIGKYEIREFKRYMWLKVFYHNMTDLVGFDEVNDALSCNEENKYSILNEINSSLKQRNNIYEFILEYPKLKTYNRWLQSNNPIDETEEEGKLFVEGFHPIHTGAKSSFWGGLSKTTNCTGSCFSLLNGSPGNTGNDNWLFGIGQLNGAYWYYGSKICKNIPSNGPPVNIVYLWIKLPQNRKITMCKHSTSHIRVDIFIYVLLCVSSQ